MATYITNNYNAIDFSALKQTNVFDTFNYLMFHGFSLNTAIAGNLSQTSVNSSYLSKTWEQQFSGNTSNGTHTIHSTDNAYSIQYVGSNIGQNANGVYKSISYSLPNDNNDTVRVTLEGSITRFTSGDLGSGTITKMTYEFGNLKVELYGTITKTFVIPTDGSATYNTFTGSITGFNFQDSNGQLSITNISPALDLVTTFDNLTFDQLAANATSQEAQTPNTSFQSLFDELALDKYKTGTDAVIVDPGTSATPGGVGDSTNPYVIPDNIEDFPLPEGSTDYYAYGNAANNVMTGNSARNFFEGRAGNDTLNGLAGDDSLKGEEGLDKLNGGDGNDTLDGGSGKDTLTGGAGNDTYVIDLTTVKGKYEDKIVEAKNASSDTLAYRSAFGVQAKPITLKLVKNFENLDVSLSNTNFNLTGDAANNVLTGNAANNVLDGGKGADTLVGGGGADTYILDNAGDIVTEALDADIDTVNVKFLSDFALVDNGSSNFSNIENAILGHTKAFGLTGNALNNTLTGNGAANTISGGDGADTLNGGKGNDTLNGDSGADTLNGGAGNDTLNGGTDDDTLNGEAGNDTLNGDSGADTLNGGAGNDFLTGGAGDDTLSGGKGKDTFDFNAADKGTVGNASVDTITDFSVKEKDVLDLRDLLDGESKADINSLLNFIDITVSAGKTEISISSTGNIGGGEDAHITLNSADLFTLTKTTTETDLLSVLITKNQLIID